MTPYKWTQEQNQNKQSPLYIRRFLVEPDKNTDHTEENINAAHS